jgi:hypothetical protein
MTRIVWSAVATGVVAMLVHFQPWVARSSSQDSCRTETEPVISPPGVPAAPNPRSPAQEPAPASTVVQANFVQVPCPANNGGVPVPLVVPPAAPTAASNSAVPLPPPISTAKADAQPPVAPPPLAGPGLPPVPEPTPNFNQPAPIPSIPPAPSPPGPGIADPPPVAPQTPNPTPGPGIKQAPPLTSPWTFHLEIVDGKNVVIAKVGKTVSFRVVCEKVELQSPQGHIQATGSVKITSQALEASSDRLTIQLQDEAVLLEGAANLKCQHEGQELELRSDRFSLKLSEIHQGKTSAAPGATTAPIGTTTAPNGVNTATRPPEVFANPGIIPPAR